MTRIAWGEAGSRVYETGIDRGVLYVGTSDGVPWNGLISVNEAPIGGASDPIYVDGEKRRNNATQTEYAATIEAFSAPDAFSQCDGMGVLAAGLFVDNQPRAPFRLAYRTLLGNDLKASGYGYKLHLVYNALASPPSKAFKTRASTDTPTTFSWGITTTPVRVAGKKSSAHFIIDSRKTASVKLATLENYLYGTPSTAPRFPDVPDLITMLT